MGVDQLVTGGDFDDPVVDSLTSDSVNTDDTRTETIGDGEYHFAADYDGADATTRLQNAISAASNHNTIFLEDAAYGDVTIDKELKLIGVQGYGRPNNGSHLPSGSTWTLNTRCIIDGLGADGADITVNDFGTRFTNSRFFDSTITVSEDGFLMSDVIDGSVVFESGTESGIVDGCSRVSVTDNGDNTVGDIA